MKAQEFIRHILGYVVGISLFFGLIPFLLWIVATHDTFSQLASGMPTSVWFALALICACGGIVFVLWSNAALFFIGKGGPTDGLGIVISPRTKHLVITGPYRYTRNPMVFGALCCYLGWGLFLHSLLVVAIVIAAAPLITWYLKKTEEKRLLRDFGEEYLEYRRRVPMLIPKFSFKKKD